jgi:PEP-CTERM motif
LRRRLRYGALTAVAAAGFVAAQIPAMATSSFTNGNFLSTNDSSLLNGQAINIYGSSSNNTTYAVTGWSQCLSTTTPACPSGTSLATGNGSSALAFLYTYGAQAQSVSDSYGVNGFTLSDTGAIPNTFPGACTTVTTGCGNYLVLDGSSGNDMAIYQSITGLTQNASYELQFYVAAGQQSGFTAATTEDWAVYFGTSEQSTTTINNPASPNDFTPWSLVTMFFTAQSTTQDLEFLAQGSSSNPPMDFLADVTLNLTATPEPSAIGLMGAGLLTLLAVGRRRKRA